MPWKRRGANRWVPRGRVRSFWPLRGERPGISLIHIEEVGGHEQHSHVRGLDTVGAIAAAVERTQAVLEVDQGVQLIGGDLGQRLGSERANRRQRRGNLRGASLLSVGNDVCHLLDGDLGALDGDAVGQFTRFALDKRSLSGVMSI
jgi:hypothetical protein